MLTLEQLQSERPEFVSAVTEAQVEANKGWNPENTGLIDTRIVECPVCGSPGMNSCFGYWAFACGATILSDGETGEPCPDPETGVVTTDSK